MAPCSKLSEEELRNFHFVTSKTHAVKYFRVPEWMDTDKAFGGESWCKKVDWVKIVISRAPRKTSLGK